MIRKLIAQGAEAKLFLESNMNKQYQIVKQRFRKKYRIEELDTQLRITRTRREARILHKLESIRFPSPRIIKYDIKDDEDNIVMEKLDGTLLKNVLEMEKRNKYKMFCIDIGKKIAILHNNSIIHGDLTTSNMIYNSLDKEIYFIDFGLSFSSEKSEDKAVDLHLLKESLKSKHYRICDDCFRITLDTYKKVSKNSDATLKRLELVERRGRYAAKKLEIRSTKNETRKTK